MVDFAVRGFMALSPSFSGVASDGCSWVKQSFDNFGSRLEQTLSYIGGSLTGVVQGVANSIFSLGGVTTTWGSGEDVVTTEAAGKMAAYAARHAAHTSLGKCALYVNNAVRSLGYKAWGHGLESARNIINSNKDFVEVAYSADYVPQDGDIMSINHGRHQYGHVAIYNAKLGKWVSDFVQHKTRGNTAATNDKDYKKIKSGQAKVTIARNVGKDIKPATKPKKANKQDIRNNNANNLTASTSSNTHTSSFISNSTSSISSRTSELNGAKNDNVINQTQNITATNSFVQTANKNRNANLSLIDNQKSSSSLIAQNTNMPLFKALGQIFNSKKYHFVSIPSVSSHNLDYYKNLLSVTNIPVVLPEQKGNVAAPIFLPKLPNTPKVTTPSVNLKLPLFGKSTKAKQHQQTVVQNSKPKDRLPVHTVVAKDSFI